MSDLIYKTLDLSTIKTIVLHNRTSRRRDHIDSVLGKTKLEYSFFNSIPRDSSLVSAIDSLIHIFTELLARPEFTPVIMLEDDINTTDQFKHVIQIPECADCVYLGLSDCYASFGARPTHKWLSVNDELVQIRDMLSLHAYVITSKQWLQVLLECMTSLKSNAYAWDIPVARKMNEYKVYAFKKPFFYQDAAVGGQQGPTKITLADISDRVL
jgi:hypothetical protein